MYPFGQYVSPYQAIPHRTHSVGVNSEKWKASYKMKQYKREEVLKQAACITRIAGLMTKGTAIRRGMERMSTAQITANVMNSGELFPLAPEDVDLYYSLERLILKMDWNDADKYGKSLIRLFENTYVSEKELPLLTSALSLVLQRKLDYTFDNSHFGEVGRKYEGVPVYIVDIIETKARFGDTYIVIMAIQDMKAVWTTLNPREVEKERLYKKTTFIVKAHSTFDGMAQTEIKHVKFR